MTGTNSGRPEADAPHSEQGNRDWAWALALIAALGGCALIFDQALSLI